jgi:hypothetical protein
MSSITSLAENLRQVPLEALLIFVALAAMGLAAYAIHAVASTVKERRRD